MKKLKPFTQTRMNSCSLCQKSTEAEGISLVYFGEWMLKKDITVHYYCLLLSSHLPQRGEDHNGILGFLLRDIRLEIAKAKNRKCIYCSEVGASIQCFTCKAYFHLTCGHTSKCLSQFVGEFKSFCHNCVPDDPYKLQLFARKPPRTTELCFICTQIMGTNPKGWIYAKCCGNGYTHSKCMKIYALSAGYYLTCIWCKDKQFREDIKYLGVFVPDRDANWEREKGAYAELYSRHKRCDSEVCNCPKGRDYSNAFKWQLIICKLCGAFGAHNPCCIPGHESSKQKLLEFKCDICSVTEQTLLSKTILDTRQDLIDTSLYVGKNKTKETEGDTSVRETEYSLSPQTKITDLCKSAAAAAIDNSELANIEDFILTQSPVTNQQISVSQSNQKDNSVENSASDDDDSVIVNLLVDKVLNIFEVEASCDESQTKMEQNKPEMLSSGEQIIKEITTKPTLKPSIRSEATTESSLHEVGSKESSDSDDSIIADFLAQKVLDVFEAT